jgi:hypothetical protein
MAPRRKPRHDPKYVFDLLLYLHSRPTADAVMLPSLVARVEQPKEPSEYHVRVIAGQKPVRHTMKQALAMDEARMSESPCTITLSDIVFMMI